MRYKDRIKKTEQEKLELEDQFLVEDAEAEVSASKRETQRALMNAKRDLEKLKSSRKFDLSAILEKQREVYELKNGMMLLEELHEELFGPRPGVLNKVDTPCKDPSIDGL